MRILEVSKTLYHTKIFFETLDLFINFRIEISISRSLLTDPGTYK